MHRQSPLVNAGNNSFEGQIEHARSGSLSLLWLDAAVV